MACVSNASTCVLLPSAYVPSLFRCPLLLGKSLFTDLTQSIRPIATDRLAVVLAYYGAFMH